MYYMELLQLWLKTHKITLHSERKIPSLPKPELYVAYNGKAPLRDEISAFEINQPNIKINVQVKIKDIHFEKLEDTSPENGLAGYAFFYKIFDECKSKGMTDDEALTQTRNECIRLGYLKGYIEKEDFIMFYKDFLDYDKQLEVQAEERGETKGFLGAAIKLLQKGTSLQEVINMLDLSDSQVDDLTKHYA